MWMPGRLAEMMRACERRVGSSGDVRHYGSGYNEVMLNTSQYVAKLPVSLAAFYVPRPADAAEVAHIRQVRARFIERYREAMGDGVEQCCPLVVLDLESDDQAVTLLDQMQ